MNTRRPGRTLPSRAALAFVAACLPVLALAASPAVQDYMYPASPAGRAIANYGWLILTAFCIATAIVWVLLAWIAFRQRGTFAEHAHVATETGRPWVVYGGLVIPGAVLLVLFVMMFGVMHAASSHSTAARDESMRPDIRVTGQQWWFEAQYLGDAPYEQVTAPTELHIPVGRDVHLELVTRDVIHSFWIPRLQGKVDLVPGTVNRVTLHAEHAGVYHGQCAEFCGEEHAKMRLLVVAEPEAQYHAWLERQRQGAADPATEQSQRGQQVFMTGACPLCHTVRGTAAQGRIGPDLTHVGSRARIAGGALANDTANLAAWVTDAQSLKPGSRMPTLKQMRGDDLRALVAYLQGLR